MNHTAKSPQSHGVVTHHTSRPTDYLYRVSLKGLIRDDNGKVLVVKEAGRDWWDLPGGGMDHGETIQQALARELAEEVNLHGDFTWQMLTSDEPKYLQTHHFWQLRLIVELQPKTQEFSAGIDADEVKFANPAEFEHSDNEIERRIYKYANMEVL